MTARSSTATRWRRAAFLLPAVLALLAGLDAALMLLGLRAPVTADRLPDVHGMLLVLGFVGTVVALERAVALRHPAGFAAPAGFGVGGLLLICPAPLVAGRVAVGCLVVHDVARRTIRSTGQARFSAGCLLAGYGWLGVAAVGWLVGGALPAGPAYDAVVHAVFLGFTLSMIMAHAPVILPAVLRRPLPYHPLMIAPAVLLHGSLVLRLWGGDARGVPLAWQVDGVLNITALLLFAGVAVWSSVRAARRADVS